MPFDSLWDRDPKIPQPWPTELPGFPGGSGKAPKLPPATTSWTPAQVAKQGPDLSWAISGAHWCSASVSVSGLVHPGVYKKKSSVGGDPGFRIPVLGLSREPHPLLLCFVGHGPWGIGARCPMLLASKIGGFLKQRPKRP